MSHHCNLTKKEIEKWSDNKIKQEFVPIKGRAVEYTEIH